MSEKEKCKYCGVEVSKINLKDHYEECYKSPNLKEIEGWLVFFVINLYLSAILILYYTISVDLFFFNILLFLYFAYVVYIIYLMHKRDKRFKKLAIYYLWSWIVLILIETVYFMFNLMDAQFYEWADIMFIQNAGFFIIGALSSFIWTLYLLKSERVKNTFRNSKKKN